MKLGRYIFYNGQIRPIEIENIRSNRKPSPTYDKAVCTFSGWSGWITVPVANSKLIRALL